MRIMSHVCLNNLDSIFELLKTLYPDYFWLNWYERFIRTRKNIAIKDQTDKHHIIPRSFFIDMKRAPEWANLIHLTYREHFIAHLILSKMFSTNKGLAMAITIMRKDETIQNSYAYSLARKNAAENRAAAMREMWENFEYREYMIVVHRHPVNLTEVGRKKLSDFNKNRERPDWEKQRIFKDDISSYWRNASEEDRQRASESAKRAWKTRRERYPDNPKCLTEDGRQRLKNACKKLIGIKRSSETRERLRLSHLGVKDSAETLKKKSFAQVRRHIVNFDYGFKMKSPTGDVLYFVSSTEASRCITCGE